MATTMWISSPGLLKRHTKDKRPDSGSIAAESDVTLTLGRYSGAIWPPNASLFPEGPHDLVGQRLAEVGDHGSLVGLNIDLNRHSRLQLGG